MMRSLIAGFMTWVTLASIAIASTSPVSAEPTEYHYRTTITPVYGSQYPIAGRLDLEMFPNGNVRGYFWWAFQKQYITVVGGRDGTYIWFDIGPCACDLSELGLNSGPGGKLHVVAYMDSNNGFSGQIYPEYAPSISGQEMMNAASPEPTANEQYLFVAKPIENPESHS